MHISLNILQNHLRIPFTDLTLLDAGCGDGLTIETFLNLGATNITAVEPSESAITLAKTRNSSPHISWHHTSIEDFATKNQKKFSLIFALEVFEHLANWQSTLNDLSTMLEPKGLIIISTLNRTAHSFITAIGLAEYALKILPRHTHVWSDFITPSELSRAAQERDLTPVCLSGLRHYPLAQKWRPCSLTKTHYLLALQK